MKFVLVLAIITVFTGCKKNNELKNPTHPTVEVITKPTIKNIEIGAGNSKYILKGRDVHFAADVLAVTKIGSVQVSIRQKSSESYTSSFDWQLDWTRYYKGTKNTNVHNHFSFPVTTPEGKYDFIFSVTDENGSKTELVETITIADPINMPIDPIIGNNVISLNGRILFSNNQYAEKDLIFRRNDNLRFQARINNIKGDGILYTALIKRKSNYNPESPDSLDFSKVIVISKIVHKGLPGASSLSTFKAAKDIFNGEVIKIGAANDNNEPSPNGISGDKAWESGQYNLVILYKNSSYNMSIFSSTPITIDYK